MSYSATAKQVEMVWTFQERTKIIGWKMYGLRSGGFKIQRLAKENREIGCGKRPSNATTKHRPYYLVEINLKCIYNTYKDRERANECFFWYRLETDCRSLLSASALRHTVWVDNELTIIQKYTASQENNAKNYFCNNYERTSLSFCTLSLFNIPTTL